MRACQLFSGQLQQQRSQTTFRECAIFIITVLAELPIARRLTFDLEEEPTCRRYTSGRFPVFPTHHLRARVNVEGFIENTLLGSAAVNQKVLCERDAGK